MKFTTELITNQNLWEAVVANADAHSFLQSWSWGEFQEQTGHAIRRIGFFIDTKLVAVALLVHVKARRGSFIFCPHGPVSMSGEGIEDLLRCLVEEAKKFAMEKKSVFIRISPLMTSTENARAIFRNCAFRDAPIHMMHPELAWMLDCTPTIECLLQGMRKTTRHCIKKAEQEGVRIRMSTNPADLDVFWRVYQATAKRQQFTAFSKEYLTSEFLTFLKNEHVALFFAEYQDRVIATAMVVFYGDAAYYHHAASDSAWSKLPAAHLLQWHAIQEAKRRGCHWYNFWGVVTEENKKHPWHGLSVFKRGFGGQEEAYLHAQDLPLSWRYWMTWLIESLRKKKRHL